MEKLGMWFGARSKGVEKAAMDEERVRFTPQTAQRIAENLRSLTERTARHAELRARRAETGIGEARFRPPTLVHPGRERDSRVA